MRELTRQAAQSLLLRLAGIAAVAVPLALIGGAAWGWAAACAGLGLIVLAQTRQLLALGRWLTAPASSEFPNASGAWGEAFLLLSRHLRGEAKARQAAEARLHSFVEAIEALPDGLILIDGNRQILWCNRAADAQLGIRQPRDLGAIVDQRVRTPGFAEHLGLAQHDQPFILQTGGERSRQYAISIVSFGDRNRIVACRDVTEARRVEAMRSDFVANVSHELRTPLTVVNGFLEHFLDDAEMDAGQRHDFARLMTEQTTRMLSLVDDLLTLSRLEADDAPPSEEILDMTALVDTLQRDAEALSGGRHHLLASSDGPPLRGNAKELHSAFGNLVSNAIRYTPEGGCIKLRWSLANGNGQFLVEDSGVGIAAEHIPRLTERFYRVDRGRSRDSGGTGLGLAIVKHVLLRHQASLRIESRPGEGSRFIAEFPAWRLVALPARAA